MGLFSTLWCKVLGALGAEDPHDWSEARQKTPHCCTYIQTCQRCDTKRESVSHIFGKWQFKGPLYCEQVRTCQICGKGETRISHEYEDAGYKSSDSCIRMKKCRRCGILEEKDAEPVHHFVNGCCQHCGEPAPVNDDDDDSGGGNDDYEDDELGHRGPLGYSGYG